MKGLDQMESVFAVATSTFKVRVGAGSSERWMKVTITLDDRMEWTFDHASWRPLAYGCGSGAAYLWSARAIVVLPTEPGGDPEVLDVDEDLLIVFKIETGWLLVCETSVRLLIEQQETSRVELGDVINHARWDEGQLMVEDASGLTTRVNVTGRHLIS